MKIVLDKGKESFDLNKSYEQMYDMPKEWFSGV